MQAGESTSQLEYSSSAEEAIAELENSENWKQSDDYGGPRFTHRLENGEWIEYGQVDPTNKTQEKIDKSDVGLQEHLQIINDLQTKGFSIKVKSSSEILAGSEVAMADYAERFFATIYTLRGNEIEIRDFEGTKKEFQEAFTSELGPDDSMDADDSDIRSQPNNVFGFYLRTETNLIPIRATPEEEEKSAFDYFWDNLFKQKPAALEDDQKQPSILALFAPTLAGNESASTDTQPQKEAGLLDFFTLKSEVTFAGESRINSAETNLVEIFKPDVPDVLDIQDSVPEPSIIEPSIISISFVEKGEAPDGHDLAVETADDANHSDKEKLPNIIEGEFKRDTGELILLPKNEIEQSAATSGEIADVLESVNLAPDDNKFDVSVNSVANEPVEQFRKADKLNADEAKPVILDLGPSLSFEQSPAKQIRNLDQKEQPTVILQPTIKNAPGLQLTVPKIHIIEPANILTTEKNSDNDQNLIKETRKQTIRETNDSAEAGQKFESDPIKVDELPANVRIQTDKETLNRDIAATRIETASAALKPTIIEERQTPREQSQQETKSPEQIRETLKALQSVTQKAKAGRYANFRRENEAAKQQKIEVTPPQAIVPEIIKLPRASDKQPAIKTSDAKESKHRENILGEITRLRELQPVADDYSPTRHEIRTDNIITLNRPANNQKIIGQIKPAKRTRSNRYTEKTTFRSQTPSFNIQASDNANPTALNQTQDAVIKLAA